MSQMELIRKLADLVLASQIKSNANYSSRKEEWWDHISYNQQRAYLKAHPDSVKKFTSHVEKLSEHQHQANLHTKNSDYISSKLPKIKDPMRQAKEEAKLDHSDSMVSYHKNQIVFHKGKIADPTNHMPLFGDEPSNQENTLETDEGDFDDEAVVDDEDKENVDINKKAKAPPPSVMEETQNTPMLQKHDLHPQSEPARKSRAKRVVDRFLFHFTSAPKNPIVRDVMQQLKGDESSLNALNSAYYHIKNKRKPSLHIIKKLGMIAAIAVAASMGSVVLGTVGTLLLAHHINEKYNHGRGFGHLAWQAVKDLKPKHDEFADNHEQMIHAIVEHLQKQLEKANTPESESSIERLIETLENAANSYSMYEKDSGYKSISKKLHKPKKSKAYHMLPVKKSH